MDPRALVRITLVSGIVAAVGAVGCSLVQPEDAGSSPDEVVAGDDVSQVLKSTLQLQGGCTAAKVGPRHLLVAARCVSGNAAFASGKSISFTPAASGKVAAAAPDAGASDAAPYDSGARDSGLKDSGADATAASNPNARDVVISDVKIHPSYVAKCTGDLCDFTKLAASDSPDIAVIILEEDLDTVPTIPVDLDPVGQADPLLVVSSSCATFDAKPTAAPKTVRTEAVAAKSVNHAGSPYATSPNLVSRLASSYVVTPAAGWKAGMPRLCKTDIGAPVFRAGAAAVAGVTSNYTTFAAQRLPVTTQHTRVDAQSRFKIGDWLTTLGAETVHSCSESAAGCIKRTSDAGEPEDPTTGGTEPGDGGKADATASDAAADGQAETPPTPEDNTPHSDQLPSEDPSSDNSTSSSSDDFSDAGAPKKKKSADKGGCSAAPGTTTPGGGFVIGLALALGAVIARRRRS